MIIFAESTVVDPRHCLAETHEFPAEAGGSLEEGARNYRRHRGAHRAMCVGAALIFDMNERRNADGSPRVAIAQQD